VVFGVTVSQTVMLYFLVQLCTAD